MKKILLGMSIWGDEYIDNFLYYGLPSLMAEGNLPFLGKERDIGFVIHTDKKGAEKLDNVLFHPVHFDIDVTDEDKYLQLGRHQHKDLLAAKQLGADYHLLMPDFVYSENFFTGVLKAAETHKAIVRLVLSTTAETLCPELEKYRYDGKLMILANHLATLGLKHIHKGVKHWLATKENYPNTHVIVWEGQNTLHLCSPHCTPIYIANEAIVISEYTHTLDCILDYIIDGDIYCPKPEDGIVMVEISPENTRQPNDKRIDMAEFIRIFKWDTDGSMKQLQIFNSETIDPICRNMLGDKYWNDVEISKQKYTINKALMKNMEN